MTLLLITALIAVLLIYPVYSAHRKGEVDFSELADAFGRAQWAYLIPAFFFGMFVFVLKAWRWQVILAPVQQVRYRSLLSAIMIGFMANCIVSRMGEIFRAVVLGTKREASTTLALATIALERLFDLFTVALFLVISLLWLRPSGSEYLARTRLAGAVMAVLLVCLTLFLVLLRLQPKLTMRWVMVLAAWLPRRLRPHVERFMESFLKGLNAIQGPRHAAMLLLLSLAHWFSQVLYFYFVGLCFPGLGLTLAGAMLVFAVTAMGVGAVPLPGYLGIFQASVTAAAAIMALPAAETLSYSWLSWAANVPPIIVIGFGFMWIEGLSVGALRRGARAQAEAERV